MTSTADLASRWSARREPGERITPDPCAGARPGDRQGSRKLIASPAVRVTLMRLVLLALVGPSCGSGNDESPASIWCDGVCAAVLRCRLPVEACHSRCVEQRPGLAGYTISAAEAVEPCLEKLSCEALGGDQMAWQKEQRACASQAALSLEVTPAARALCPAHATALFNCGFLVSIDDCEHTYSMWTDAVTGQIALCDTKPTCNELLACQKTAYGTL